MLCPNYNDALSANLTAFVNRLTALFRQTRFYDKALFAIVVSGYSGGDILARQLISFGEGDSLTPAMINNYIKDGLLARANGKKYDQEHLAYLTAISAMKQVLSVREMRTLIAIGQEGRNSKRLYDFFWQTLDEALNETAARLDETTSDHDLPKLVLALALRSYVDGLACRRVLAIMAQREGHGDLLDKGRKK